MSDMDQGSRSKRESWRRDGPLRLGAVVALLLAVGCGGGGGGGTTNPPTPVRSLIQSGSFNVASVADANAAGLPFDAGRTEFSTSGAGTLEVSVDWTFSSNAIGFVVYRGSCSFNSFYANACGQSAGEILPPSSKPARLTITNLAAGLYTLVIANAGPGAESGTYQIFLTR